MTRLLFPLLLIASTGMAQDQSTEDISHVQEKLAESGYDIKELSGELDDATVAAIRQYQLDWELPDTGIVSEELISRLDLKHPDTKAQYLHAIDSNCLVFVYPMARLTLHLDGPCEEGRASGFVKVVLRGYLDGAAVESVYEGNMRDGKADGQGAMKADWDADYEGEWKNGDLHGSGSISFLNGNRYDGEFRENKFHGHGTLLTSNGIRFEGEFEEDQFVSGGVDWPNGDSYEGAFMDFMKHGHGKSTWVESGTYTGEWKNDRRHGYGVYEWNNGDRYEGQWQAGRLHGYGILIMADGDRYEGEFQDDHLFGEGVMMTSDGLRLQGQWEYGCIVEWAADSEDYSKEFDCS